MWTLKYIWTPSLQVLDPFLQYVRKGSWKTSVLLLHTTPWIIPTNEISNIYFQLLQSWTWSHAMAIFVDMRSHWQHKVIVISIAEYSGSSYNVNVSECLALELWLPEWSCVFDDLDLDLWISYNFIHDFADIPESPARSALCDEKPS
jgi:hypothetical protein